MSNRKITDWLPTTRKEAELRGWDELDVVMFSGDAYVDHPSFGAAVIGRLLEAEGILLQKLKEDQQICEVDCMVAGKDIVH